MDKVIEEFTDITSSAMMEDGVIKEPDDIKNAKNDETKMSRWLRGRNINRDWNSKSEKFVEIISKGKGITPNAIIEEINEDDLDHEWPHNIGGDDDNYVEESEIRSSEDNVNNNDDNLVVVFDESTCSGDSVCDIL